MVCPLLLNIGLYSSSWDVSKSDPVWFWLFSKLGFTSLSDVGMVYPVQVLNPGIGVGDGAIVPVVI